jgi:hypothetical protein
VCDEAHMAGECEKADIQEKDTRYQGIGRAGPLLLWTMTFECGGCYRKP